MFSCIANKLSQVRLGVVSTVLCPTSVVGGWMGKGTIKGTLFCWLTWLLIIGTLVINASEDTVKQSRNINPISKPNDTSLSGKINVIRRHMTSFSSELMQH